MKIFANNSLICPRQLGKDSGVVNDPLLVLKQAPERTAHFVERGSVSSNDVLAKLAKHHRVVISGLPGVGKSELATQIVEKAIGAAKTYKGVFWLSSASEAILRAGIYEMAREVKLLPHGSAEIETVRQTVVDELEKQDHWLMVLDNVDDIDLIKSFLPVRRGTRHVLITTPYHEAHMAIKGNLIDLENMIDSEASLLFFKVYRADDQHENEAGDSVSVAELVRQLGYLPLAIIQAAAYSRESQDDILNYTEIYSQAREAFWEWKPEQGSEYMSVATVMALSFKKIKDRKESVRLFCLSSFLAPDNIPELLWTSDPRLQDETLRSVFRSKEDLNRALAPLCSYYFVKRSSVKHSISIHRVVQDVIKDIIEGHIKDEGNVLESLNSHEAVPTYWIERAVETLISGYPDSINPDTWNVCETINPHVPSASNDVYGTIS